MRRAVIRSLLCAVALCGASVAADPPGKPPATDPPLPRRVGPAPQPAEPPGKRPSAGAASTKRVDGTGQEPAVERVGDWKLESIRLQDGRTYFGLIQTEREGELDFAEIVRQPGKPMFAVVRPVSLRLLDETRRLSGAERAELVARFQAFRNRAHIEAGRMEDIQLEETTRDGAGYLRYDGNWFTLLSTADEEATRRSVVRIEQIFRAYRQLLPPRTGRAEKVEILLYGSGVQYRADLARRKLEVENPAFYSANLNLIVAGSELKRYAAQLARIRKQNEATRRHYESLQADFSNRLVKLAEELKRNGFTREEISEETRIRRGAWEDEYKSLLAEIVEANRRNDALFGEVTRRMFGRLNHEAFHAYLENHVYPHREAAVPRWLNEGLAQIFENGQLDGDVLRVDAPHRGTLLALQADLAGEPLPLSELLAAQEKAFLVTHVDGSSQRHYLYSWGLAWYLTFYQNLLGSTSLDRYVGPEGAALSPVARFEQLVEMPLVDFERRWRAEMRAIKPPAK